ncbi:MAG: ROK family transcriptional regulator [Lachnospiraceae bacterium]|nr:ROK family transcriptional regulator [Lachnospiraceae bacterium]
MVVTGSKEMIRDINSHLVLETILNEGPISRASISQKLGLTKATISAIVSDLIDKDLIREIGSDDTSLGRKPILLEFCKENGHLLSIDLGVDTITALTADLKGNDCGLKMFPNNYTRNNIISGLIYIINSCLEELPKTPFGLTGIAIGVHGATNGNEIIFAPYYDYTGLPIADMLSEHFNVPVFLENEANLSVVGEKCFCYNVPNMIGLSVHSGVGAGIIINGELYSGLNGNAGEIGHTIINVNGLKCPCGNHGCLEQYASERAILSKYASIKGIDKVTIEEFVSAYNAGDRYASDLVDQFILYISVAVNNLLNTFNPDVIVINSGFTINIPELHERIREQLKNRMNKYCTLVPSGLQDISILLGGACLIIKKYLGVDYLAPNSDFIVG